METSKSQTFLVELNHLECTEITGGYVPPLFGNQLAFLIWVIANSFAERTEPMV